jgi:peptidoglycan/xylan/chitin deacetylase (PgdA/CDA1 family)
MAKAKQNRLLHKVKQGLASLIICAVVALPLLSIYQLVHVFVHVDPRKATPLAAMHVRPADNTLAAPQLFEQPLLSVTFDDGWGTVYTQAMPELQKDGIVTTQYVLSGVEKDTNYLSDAQIKQIQKAGHQIASHTVSHPDLLKISDAQLDHELGDSKTSLQQRFGGSVNDFASPYSSFNAHTIAYMKKYYRSHVNTNGDYSNGINKFDVNIDTGFNRYDIIRVAVRRDTTVQDLRNLVAYAKANNGWLVLAYHQIDDGNAKFGQNSKEFNDQLAYLSSTDVRIASVGQVMDNLPEQYR